MSLIEKLLEKQAQKTAQEAGPETPPGTQNNTSDDSRPATAHPPEKPSDASLADLSDDSPLTTGSVQTADPFTLPELPDDVLKRFSDTPTEDIKPESSNEIDWNQPADLFETPEPENNNEFDNNSSTSYSATPLFSPSPTGDAHANPDQTSQTNDRASPHKDGDEDGDDILALFQSIPSLDTPATTLASPEPRDTSTPGMDSPEPIDTAGAASGNDFPQESNRSENPAAELSPEFSDAALDALIAGAPPPRPAHTPNSPAAKPPLKSVHIDLDRLDEGGIITPNGTNNKISEEYRLIKRPLLLNILGEGSAQMQHPNLIMVSSSIPGEGKTFSSVNLAMSLAMELDRTVLLVDADVAKPSFSRVFDIEVEMGLIDILLGDATLEDTLLKTNIPKLTILPAGRRHQNSVELLGSEHMRSLTNELATRYEDRIIVFDSPPLLATTEAGVLAGLMSQIVVVVEANKTPHYVVREALSQLDPEKYISLLLNKTQKNSGSGYYYYYDYNYKDSYYYGYE